MKKGIVIFAAGILGIVLLPLVVGWAYSLDRESCYERLGKGMGVQAEHSAIKERLYETLLSKLTTGSSYTAVSTELSQVAPHAIVRRDLQLDGAYKEVVILDMCRFKRNGFTFMFIYTKGDHLEKILKFLDD